MKIALAFFASAQVAFLLLILAVVLYSWKYKLNEVEKSTILRNMERVAYVLVVSIIVITLLLLFTKDSAYGLLN